MKPEVEGKEHLTLEQENTILKRQLTTALTALERIRDRSKCPSGSGGCPRYLCPHETAAFAMVELTQLSREKHSPVSWGVRFINVTEDGWRADFFVEQQSFTFFEDQGEEENDGETSETILNHAKWFKDMFFYALAKLGVDTSTAKECVEEG